MADQQQSWATICGGTPPELNVRRLQIGDRFVQTADLRVATERCFLADDRGMCADKRVGGSRGKLYRCDGAVFDIKSKAKETIVRAFGNPRRKNGCLLRTYTMLWGYQECKSKSSAGRGCQVH